MKIKTFKKFNENFNLLSYFKNIWSKDKLVKDKVISDENLLKKYAQYFDPDFNWVLLSDDELEHLYSDWARDEQIF